MQLSNEILSALREYAKKLIHPVNLEVAVNADITIIDFVNAVASTSDLIDVKQDSTLPKLGIRIASKKTNNIMFNGIPGGHEFNSFVLALLHTGGHPLTLDKGMQDVISRIETPISFEVFVSLSCHNCPDIAQTLSQFAVVNPLIRVEIIDGGVNKQRIEDNDIQGVPTVYANRAMFASGKVEPATLLEKLLALAPAKATSEKMLPTQDVTVIGGGPAGVSAAIYSARKGLNVTLVAQRLGGQVKDTMGIENFISIPYTTGTKLSDALRKHINEYDVNLKEAVSVTSTDAKGKEHVITLNTGEEIETKTVIIATGAQWRKLGVTGEEEYSGRGVAYCPHCDGPFYKGKRVAVIGGGNSGIEAAIDLAGITEHVTVIEFMSELKADQVLVDKARSLANIEILTNQATTEIVGDGKTVTGIKIKNNTSGALGTIPVSGVFVQIGLIPNSKGFGNIVETNSFGEINVDDKCKTSAKGIFACGDVTTTPYKQIIIASGEGAKASLSAFEYLMTG